MFYLLSLITGILECGWIAYGVVLEFPLWQILCYPLAYHVGNLFPKPFTFPKPILLGMNLFSLVVGVTTMLLEIPMQTEFFLTCVALFCLSAVIQSVRSGKKSEGNRLCKRIFRVAGFALAPLAVVLPSLMLLVSSVVALFGMRDYKGIAGVCKMSVQKGYSAVMIFHQMHYFFYAHITLAAVCRMLYSVRGIGGVILGALLFCGTWVTYMSVEPVVSKRPPRLLMVFFVGHIGIAVLLVCMSIVNNSVLFIVLWLVTGFCGGVVYTISGCAKRSGVHHKDSMTIAENIGHTGGLATTVLAAVFLGNAAPEIMLILGSISALLAVLCMRIINRKEKNHEIITD